MKVAVSRRGVLKGTLGFGATALLRGVGFAEAGVEAPLEEFGYEAVRVSAPRQAAQRQNVTDILTGLNEDSLLLPFRAMSGKAAPGKSLGGWYAWKPDYDHHHGDAGFAPASTFGQWTSAMARLSAGGGGTELGERAVRLNGLMGDAVGTGYFEQTRFPGYSFDKLVCGLMDAHRLIGDEKAFATMDKVADVAEPSMPGKVVEREVQWRLGRDISYMWEEFYTLPENLYLVAGMGAGVRYRRMAEAYLDDAAYFEPLSRGVNVLGDRHAYSYVNALCSAMQAYLSAGSEMHLRAAVNGFEMLQAQGFATGGWGPDELLRAPGYDEVAKSLTQSRNGFEAPCGSYAHMKLTRYLLRATRDGKYGDSMERVMLNTVLGALPLVEDGRTFYSQDYNTVGVKVYSVHRWPCCSGTLPQVVADYGINTWLREPGASGKAGTVWVNLYQASEVRWADGRNTVSLEQVGSYPEEPVVRIRVTAREPTSFALKLRVPEWAAPEATLKVNGKTVPVELQKGFASVERVWRGGDVVELGLPMELRLESLADHPDTVALMYGPWVLFALREQGEVGVLTFDQDALLNAERSGLREWTVGGSRKMVPFTEVGEQEYSTYLKVTA